MADRFQIDNPYSGEIVAERNLVGPGGDSGGTGVEGRVAIGRIAAER